MKRIFASIAALAAILAIASCSGSSDIDLYCPMPANIFTVSNTSASAVTMFVPEHGQVECDYVTGELPEVLSEELSQTFIRIAAHGYVNFHYSCWEPDVVSPISGYHPQDKVTFYFFDPQVLEDNEWATVVEQELWLARYSYSPDDVIAMDKVISYPAK